MFRCILIAASFSIVLSHSTSHKWSYKGVYGPSNWNKAYPHCGGSHQSPVNIITSETVYNANLTNLNFTLKFPHSISLMNNGKTVEVVMSEGSCTFSNGPLDKKDEYELKQYHFHWGSKDGNGSEHTVDGKSYSAELHLVHWKSSYGSFEEALNHTDGLIVLAVFLDVQNGTENENLEVLQRNFPNVSQPNITIPFNLSINPYLLLPENKTSYWTYSGSLTTPPCLEVVTFVIYEEPIKVTHAQMQAFRDLKTTWMIKEQGVCRVERARLEDNFRSTLPLNGRKIEASFK